MNKVHEDNKLLKDNQMSLDTYNIYNDNDYNGQSEVEREQQVRDSISIEEAINKALEDSQIQNQVLVTYNYDIFKFMEGNRNVNVMHLNRMKSSLDKKQLPIPLIVTTNMEIFEGQHRYMACREMGLPIYYIIVEGLTLNDAISINTVSKKWSAEDYFQHYLALGKPEYIKLKQFMDETGLSLHNARTFLDNVSAKGSKQQTRFYNGEFKIDDYNKSMRMFKQHLDYAKCPAFNKAACKLAIIKVMNHPLYEHDRMILKLDQLAYKITNRVTTADYLLAFSEVYNYNTSKDKKVYFHIDY